MSYSNIVLKGIEQNVVVQHLTEIKKKAWVSPPVNDFLCIYDSCLGAPADWKLLQFINCNSHLKVSLEGYNESSHELAIAFMTSYYSDIFKCSALGFFAYDELYLEYYAYNSGILVDKYTNMPELRTDDISQFSVGIVNGDASNLCKAFSVNDSNQIKNLQVVLDKPVGYSNCYSETDTRYNLILKSECYDSHTRHEAISRILGIHPCWVVGLDYSCISQGDMCEFYEDIILNDNIEFSCNDAYLSLIHT
jgi:hypothetical protein